MTQTLDSSLDQALEDTAAGRIPMDSLMDILMESQVFMPVRDTVGIKGNQGVPMILAAEDGTEVIILFSGPDKAKAFLAEIPEYEGGLITEFTWVLEKITGNYGVSLNPDSEQGLDLEPEMVQKLRLRCAAQTQDHS